MTSVPPLGTGAAKTVANRDITIRAQRRIDQRVERLIGNAPGVLRRDTNVLTAAHTPGLKGMSSGAVDPLAYVAAYDQGRYAQSVAATPAYYESNNSPDVPAQFLSPPPFGANNVCQNQ